MIILACVLAIASCIPWQKLLMVCFSDSMFCCSSSKSVLNINRPSRTEFCRSHTDCNQCQWISRYFSHYCSKCYKMGFFPPYMFMGLILVLSFYPSYIGCCTENWILMQQSIKACKSAILIKDLRLKKYWLHLHQGLKFSFLIKLNKKLFFWSMAWINPSLLTSASTEIMDWFRFGLQIYYTGVAQKVKQQFFFLFTIYFIKTPNTSHCYLNLFSNIISFQIYGLTPPRCKSLYDFTVPLCRSL